MEGYKPKQEKPAEPEQLENPGRRLFMRKAGEVAVGAAAVAAGIGAIPDSAEARVTPLTPESIPRLEETLTNRINQILAQKYPGAPQVKLTITPGPNPTGPYKIDVLVGGVSIGNFINRPGLAEYSSMERGVLEQLEFAGKLK